MWLGILGGRRSEPSWYMLNDWFLWMFGVMAGVLMGRIPSSRDLMDDDGMFNFIAHYIKCTVNPLLIYRS